MLLYIWSYSTHTYTAHTLPSTLCTYTTLYAYPIYPMYYGPILYPMCAYTTYTHYTMYHMHILYLFCLLLCLLYSSMYHTLHTHILYNYIPYTTCTVLVPMYHTLHTLYHTTMCLLLHTTNYVCLFVLFLIFVLFLTYYVICTCTNHRTNDTYTCILSLLVLMYTTPLMALKRPLTPCTPTRYRPYLKIPSSGLSF